MSKSGRNIQAFPLTRFSLNDLSIQSAGMTSSAISVIIIDIIKNYEASTLLEPGMSRVRQGDRGRYESHDALFVYGDASCLYT